MPVEVLSTREGYDRWAEIYDGEDNALVALESEHIGSLIGDVRGLAVADIGCGTGRHSIPLAESGAKVTALDFSDAMLARARAKPGAERVVFVRHDLLQPFPLASQAFDRVLCCLVLDHIAELDALLREMGRICRANGIIVVSVIHPAMMLRGIQARFVDPASGNEIRPESATNQLSSYVMAALRAGLRIEHLSEHHVDDALAARSARAVKYLGWPLLLLMGLRPAG